MVRQAIQTQVGLERVTAAVGQTLQEVQQAQAAIGQQPGRNGQNAVQPTIPA